MTDLIPAVLPESLEDLRAQLGRLSGVAPLVQIDLVSENIFEGQEEIPLWKEFDFECDVMLPHPEREVLQLVEVGFSRIIIHAQNSEALAALHKLQHYRQGDYAVAVGVALRSHDTPHALTPFVGLYDYVQVMGIDREGAQGQPPDPHHKEIELLRALRVAHPQLVLQVDGAVAPHARELASAGANRLVVGSAIVGTQDPKAAYEALYTGVNA